MRYLLSLLLLIAIQSSVEAKLYKWVDENGNVQYSDKMPPNYVDQSHAELDQRGLPIKQVERAMTPEEVAEKKRIEELRRETQKRLREQKAKDRVLLKTFQSEDDIILARDGKLNLYDTHIRIAYKNIEQLKARLAIKKKKAANLERQGKKIPNKLQRSIDNIRQQIKDNYASILRQGENKKQVREKYGADLARFRELKKLTESKSMQTSNKEQYNAIVKTAVLCTEGIDCDAVWMRAKKYAKENATTPVYVDSSKIFITKPPKTNDDVSVTVSRLRPKKDQPEIIFLDIQCKKSTIAEPWCKTQQAQQMREQFRAVVLDQQQP